MKFLLSLCAAALIAIAPRAAIAQDYPSQNIHLINGFPAGSGADVIVRWIGERLRVLSGRTIIVENRVGAGGNIAIEYMVRSKPDGHTIYISAGTGVAANWNMLKKPPYDVRKQIVNAATLHRQALMLSVATHRPWKTLSELTAHLKERGDKATYATSAVAAQVLGEIYKDKAGLKAVQVVYKTAQDSLNDIMADTVDFNTNDPVFSISQWRAGKLRILGISTPTRMRAVPELPTMREAGVDIDFTAWFGVMVPAATPKPIVARINGWINTIMATDEARQFFSNTAGGDPLITNPDEANALLMKAVTDWEDYVRIAKIEKM